MSRLTGKTVLITGAASGIGAAAVKRFLEDGANVVAVDIDLTKVEASIAAHPVDRTVALAGDTSKKLDAAAAVRVERLRGRAATPQTSRRRALWGARRPRQQRWHSCGGRYH